MTLRNKYGAKKAEFAGRMFDSTAERDRAVELHNTYLGVEHQPRLELEPGIFYKPDFSYIEHGRLVYEDVKGVETERFRLVKKLWRLHGKGVLRITKRRNKREGFRVVQEIPGGGA